MVVILKGDKVSEEFTSLYNIERRSYIKKELVFS